MLSVAIDLRVLRNLYNSPRKADPNVLGLQLKHVQISVRNLTYLICCCMDALE